MKNIKAKAVTVIAVLIFAAAAIWCAVILMRGGSENVKIMQDGKLIYTIDLSKVKDQKIEVEYKGRKNVIEIKDGRIHMLEADCPDHICVDTGWLENVPIVCLPNRLVIEFEESGNDAEVR